MPRPRRRRGPLARALGQMSTDLWLQGVALSSLTVALTIMGLYLALALNLDRALHFISTGASLVVVLEDTVSLADGHGLAAGLAQASQVREARYVSREEALARLRRRLGPHQGLLEEMGRNPLPATIELDLDPRAGPGDALAASLGRRPQIAQVITARPWLGRLARARGILADLALGLGGLLLAGVVLMVANVVRLAVYQRRADLGVMALVGASRTYLALPLIIEALIQALLAAGLASLASWGLLRLVAGPAPLPLGLSMADLLVFDWRVPAALAGISCFAALLGGFLAVGRSLRQGSA